MDDDFAAELRKLGAFIRIVPRFSYLHPYTNKLRFFEIPELFAYDTIMLLDCDTVVVQDPESLLDSRTFQARIEDGANVPHAIFERLFSMYGLMMSGKDYVSAVTAEEMIWYCNSGVLIFPVRVSAHVCPGMGKIYLRSRHTKRSARQRLFLL